MTDLATERQADGASTKQPGEPADVDESVDPAAHDIVDEQLVDDHEVIDESRVAQTEVIDESPAHASDELTPAGDAEGGNPASDGASDGGDPVYAWAPSEPQPKRKRTGLWIGAAAALVVVGGLVATSLILIAPGTSVAGVSVGLLTPGAGADAVAQRLAETTVVITGEDGEVEVTGAELGATVDARELADTAFAEHPMWNPTTWFASPVDASVTVDPLAATEALRAAMPDVYVEPVDAAIAFDAAAASYVVTPATPGTGLEVESVQSALQEAFDSGETRIEIDAVLSDVPALISTEEADATVAELNAMLDTVGFYIGEERTVPVDRAVAASWLTVAPGEGEFEITADPAAIQPVVDTLAAAVNRAPENAHVITDSAGKVLREDAAGQTGREVADTSNVASDFATQLADGVGAFQIPVTEVPVTTVALARRIEVDLGEQRAYLYENEQVVRSWLISSGLDGHETDQGRFRIGAKLRSQAMGNPDTTQWPYYYVKDVPYVMYYNGDEALHGVYWHNNFGNRMSHGCVNFPVGVAAFIYDWAPIGTEVWVHG